MSIKHVLHGTEFIANSAHVGRAFFLIGTRYCSAEFLPGGLRFSTVLPIMNEHVHVDEVLIERCWMLAYRRFCTSAKTEDTLEMLHVVDAKWSCISISQLVDSSNRKCH